MKKLILGKLKLVAEDVLQRSQLAGIYGGSGGSDCSDNICGGPNNITCCASSDYCSGPTGNCIRMPSI